MSGESCEMDKIKKLSDKYKFKIIEDASHAIGGSYNGNPIGSCEYSDISIFSFHPVKLLQAEKRRCPYKLPDLDQRLKILRSHGITRNKNQMEHPSDDGWYYEQIDLGFNYRMSDIHAALGLSQLSRLNAYVDKRHEIAKTYDQEFLNTSVQIPLETQIISQHCTYILFRWKRKNIKEYFISLRKNILVNLHYILYNNHFIKNLVLGGEIFQIQRHIIKEQ